jgi:hypothetical protein
MQAADYIKKIYSESPKPLYLSKLGGILKRNNLIVENLREFIESMEGFTVACGPEKERTAIATIGEKEEVEALLNEMSQKIDSETLQFLSKLPRTLLFAFASKKKANPNVYIMPSPPHRFGFVRENESMVEIQNNLLIDAKIPINIKYLDVEITNKLYENIKKWIGDNDFDLSAYEKGTQKSFIGNQLTLLEEMMNAIPANKRSKVVLPLDIIGHLMKKR